MKICLKQVNLDSNITIAKSKSVKVFIVILNLEYTENIKMERKNITNSCWLNIDESTW